MTIIILSLIGFAICVYGYIVERNFAKNPSYHAACDISDRVSCTKLFTSKYGKMFGVSNIILGMIFYITMTVLAYLGMTTLVFYGAVIAFLGTVVFAYISYVVMKVVCPLCTSIYVVNIALLIVSYFNW